MGADQERNRVLRPLPVRSGVSGSQTSHLVGSGDELPTKGERMTDDPVLRAELRAIEPVECGDQVIDGRQVKG